MLNLLVDLLIFNSSQSAVTALIAVCKSASDKPGLTKANDNELEVLFNALKHENQCVRGKSVLENIVKAKDICKSFSFSLSFSFVILVLV